MAISVPIGCASYPVIQWAGDGSTADDGFNPSGYAKHNYNMQHQIAFVTDYVLELPLVPAITTTEALTQASRTSNVATLTALAALPTAKNTVRTPFTFASSAGADGTAAARFAVQKDNATDVAAYGDWHVNYTTGVITVYAAEDIANGWYTLTYSNYASAPTGSNVSKFACALGDLHAGDFVKCNADSNFVEATPNVNGDTTTFYDGWAEIMGQVLEVEDMYGKDALDKVRTAYANLATDASGSLPGYAGQMDQMAGSANGGVPTKVHYAGAANLVVRINLISR